MKLSEFMGTIDFKQCPPSGLSVVLEALWWVRKGDWEKAHDLAQEADSRDGHWVHAHLHRMEGDFANASYWYGRAGKTAQSSAFEEEWKTIAVSLLENEQS